MATESGFLIVTEKEKKARSGRPRSSNKDISAQIKSAIAEHMKEDATANIAEILASIQDTPAPTTDTTVAAPAATAANTASMEARTTALAQKLTRIAKRLKTHR